MEQRSRIIINKNANNANAESERRGSPPKSGSQASALVLTTLSAAEQSALLRARRIYH